MTLNNSDDVHGDADDDADVVDDEVDDDDDDADIADDGEPAKRLDHRTGHPLYIGR